LFSCDRLAHTVAFVESSRVGVIVCRDAVADGTWEDLQSRLDAATNAPKLIVASPEPTTKLWNAVLTAGADYVLSIPFDSSDVLRSIGDAWHRWWFFRMREARFDSSILPGARLRSAKVGGAKNAHREQHVKTAEQVA
jgi:hypothetical protein